MTGRPENALGRAARLAAAGLFLAAACQQPAVGSRTTAPAASEGPAVTIREAQLDLHGHVVATFSVSRDGIPLSLAEVQALSPRFTLATLSAHPVDRLRAWRSQLLIGSGVAGSLPPSGPGTPAGLVLQNARQPGAEVPATILDLQGGTFRYVFQNAVASFDPDETVRVGLWLSGAKAPSLRTSTTYDFRPSGGPMEGREIVLDADCNGCHGNLLAHGTRAGAKLCLTCHTWQAADPDTIDPAALVTAATTTSTDPNPLELGRMIHRIHRGSRLPTLYQSSSSRNPAPELPGVNGPLPPADPVVDTTAIVQRLPFAPANNTTALMGRKYAIVGYRSSELVVGAVVQRAENGLAPRAVVEGIAYPRDLRDCDACHRGAPQAYEVYRSVSRRTCAGCHPDVWFGATPGTLDPGHFAHVGGPRADDTRCASCHVQSPAGWKLYAPVQQVHLPPFAAPSYDRPAIQILAVENLVPGGAPRIRFRLSDRVGPIAPSPRAPQPPTEPGSAAASPVPRRLEYLFIRVNGSASPEYGGVGDVALASGAWGVGHPDPLALTTLGATDEYVYAFSTTVGTVPPSATGTWTVQMEGRRSNKVTRYDPSTDTFRWPYTGETITEAPDNAFVNVDVAAGRCGPSPACPVGLAGGSAPRRTIVSEQKCLGCHGGRLELHGSLRNGIAGCVLCHTAQATDWSMRPKVSGLVDLAATLDGIEERSIHFKVLIHRIHTGARVGPATLADIAPHVVYGYGGTPYFFDDVEYPADLRNCTLCHEGKSYLVDAVPPGAPPTVANETGTIRHAANNGAHAAGEPSRPPVQAACLGCHTGGASVTHAASKTVGGVETCTSCHTNGALAVEVVHGLAPATGAAAGTTFSSIVRTILVPRCATSACHAAGGTPPILEGSAAYDQLVGVQSGQSSLMQVEPNQPERSYLVHKLRGTAASVGGSVATIMPTDGALAPADLAAIEAWIANGAPND